MLPIRRLNDDIAAVDDSELRIVSEFFTSQGAANTDLLDTAALDRRLQRLKDAAKLLSYREWLSGAVNAVAWLRIVPAVDPDVGGLSKCVRLLEDLERVQLKETERILRKVVRHVAGLQPFHLRLLVELGRASQVISFIQTEGSDFQVSCTVFGQFHIVTVTLTMFLYKSPLPLFAGQTRAFQHEWRRSNE